MNGKVKFRIGDTVYHKTLNLGAGKVRFIYRTEVLVDFTNATPARYAKEELSKIAPSEAQSAAA